MRQRRISRRSLKARQAHLSLDATTGRLKVLLISPSARRSNRSSLWRTPSQLRGNDLEASEQRSAKHHRSERAIADFSQNDNRLLQLRGTRKLTAMPGERQYANRKAQAVGPRTSSSSFRRKPSSIPPERRAWRETETSGGTGGAIQQKNLTG